nr:snaclec purpureotin subunit beta-like [Lytechinus pictus]
MRSRNSLSDSIHGRWNRVTCTSLRRHICQIPLDINCRWREHAVYQYLIRFEPRETPSDARPMCQSFGGDLAIIKTSEVNDFLTAQLPPFNDNDPYFCFFFGLQKIGSDFIWLDGTPLEYNDWYTVTEPNNVNSWGCLGLRDDGPTWFDQHNSASLPYICERTQGMTISTLSTSNSAVLMR